MRDGPPHVSFGFHAPRRRIRQTIARMPYAKMVNIQLKLAFDNIGPAHAPADGPAAASTKSRNAATTGSPCLASG